MAPITIKVKTSTEAAFPVTTDSTAKVSELKTEIQKVSPAEAGTAPPRLIFAGKVLKDDDTLETYKVVEGSTIHMVRAAQRAAPSSSTSTSNATPSTPASTPANPTPATSTPTTPNPFAALGGAGAGNPFAALAGLGGAGAGGVGSPFGGAGGVPGAMDPNMINQLMSNPAVAQSVAGMLSNPQFMDAMIASNPQLAGMMTPEMRQMMSDPNMMRMMMQMMPLMGGMGGGAGMGLGGMGAGANPFAPLPPGGAPGAGSPGANPLFNPALLSMLGGGLGGAPGGAAGTPQSTQPPEERFQVQLRQLQEMGFYDATENVRALTLTNGNVEAAVEWLFAHPPGAR